MTRAIAVIVALALPAYAQDAGVPADAPVVKRGDVVPFDGLLLSDAQAIETAKRLAASEARAKALEAGVRNTPPWWVVPLVAVVALGAGVGIGYGVTQATRAP